MRIARNETERGMELHTKKRSNEEEEFKTKKQ